VQNKNAQVISVITTAKTDVVYSTNENVKAVCI